MGIVMCLYGGMRAHFTECVCVCMHVCLCECFHMHMCVWLGYRVCLHYTLFKLIWLALNRYWFPLFCSLWLSLSPSLPPPSVFWLCTSISKAAPLPSTLISSLLPGHLPLYQAEPILHSHYNGTLLWNILTLVWIRVNVSWPIKPAGFRTYCTNSRNIAPYKL